ncbi:hypothetical protein CDD82_2603 [Ophiocordyceps australis]|uniref:LysM domain-containing protein n=1 Tax=Ophiocordyceps australis TaxID=1399860 RepID=A0A2C5XDU1_9HYPO|nr:hypothetical protein CDD82_2603 [Ophiocordyceps australis]
MSARLTAHGALTLLFAYRVLSLSSRAELTSSHSQVKSIHQLKNLVPLPPPLSSDSKSTNPSECLGVWYTVQAGDSCNSISHSSHVAVDRIVELNHLDYDCATLTPGFDLCLEAPCQLHIVEEGDTCSSIVSGKGFSRIQLVSWNP